MEVEVPNGQHEGIVITLGYFLTAWSKAGNGGRALASGYKVRISERRGVKPDVQFYRRENGAALGQEQGLVEGTPDLVVEIGSPSSERYDRVMKLRYYAERGVPEYWIVDGRAKTVERLVLREGSYSIAESRGDEETFCPASFEGLEIPLADLWS